MKRICIFIVLFLLFFNIDIYCQEPTTVLIKTPFCHEPNIFLPIQNVQWNDDDIENSKQVWLYSGGIYKLDYLWNFIKKSNYLDKFEMKCMDIDGQNSNIVYLGIKGGYIYKSTNYGQSWLSNVRIATNNNLIINYLSMNDVDGIYLAGTNDGIYKTTDFGENWTQSLPNVNVKCMILVSSYFYIAANYGIYKSTNNGTNWVRKKICEANILYYSNGTFYAGTYQSGLLYSTDGEDWNNELGSGSTSWNITSVLKYSYNNNDYFLIGTQSHKFQCYNGTSWSDNVNDGFSTTYQINSILKYTNDNQDYLIAATENSIYESDLKAPNDINWNNRKIKSSNGLSNENATKMLYVKENEPPQEDDLWVVCYGGIKYNSAESETEPAPSNPSNWDNFNCHHYAWHFTEGGLKGVSGFHSPNYHNYINTNESENWDYIEATVDDIANGNWDKVTYGDPGINHSGIKCVTENCPYPSNPFIEESIKVISKWTNIGPLVKHLLHENPWYLSSSTPIRYWKSKKIIIGDITTDQTNFIGRQIESDVVIQNEPNHPIVNFYVAPMYNHFIHLKSGFHAESGCTLHVFVKDYCDDLHPETKDSHIPWEDYGYGILGSRSEEFDTFDKLKNLNKGNISLQLKVYPNPSDGFIKINTKIIGYDNDCPINIKFYTISGKLVKTLILNNGMEKLFNISDMNSGAYLVAGYFEFTNEKDKFFHVSDSELIVIEK